MLKKKTKFIVLLLAFLLIISTFSFATNTAVPTSEEEIVTGDNTITEGGMVDENGNPVGGMTDEDIHDSDLYIFDNDIVMDKLVDGNVFLFGNNIKVTGRVNGCLYAFGNTISLEEDSYIMQATYVMANELIVKGTTTDLYASARKIDAAYSSFIIRDMRVVADSFNFSGCVGRDAFVGANNFNFDTTEGKSAIIYGNLTYSSSNELSLGSDSVQGDINYHKESIDETSTSSIIISKIISLCNSILYVLVVFLLCIWLAPKFLQKTSSYMEISNCAKSFGIGILSIIIGFVLGIALLFTVVGIPIGLALIVLTILLISIATAITSIAITHKLKEKFAYSKNYMTYLTLIGIVVVIWALNLIPYFGAVVSFIINSLGVGIVINYIFEKKHNEKTNKSEI